jgi:hypothetical protein
MPPERAGCSPDCLTRGSRPVGDQLAGVAKAGDVADRGQEGGGGDQVHARDGHQPLGLGPGQHLRGDQPLDLLDLTVQERDVAQRGLDRLCLLGRQAQLAKPAAALDAEQIRARRLALQPAHQYRVHLVLDPSARADQLLAPRQSPPQHAGALVGHPHRLKLARHRRLASVRASSLSVLVRACAIPLSSGETTTTRST